MTDLDLTEIAAARGRLREEQDELRRVRLDLAAATARLTTAQARGDLAAAAETAHEVRTLDERRGTLVGTVRNRFGDVRTLSDAILAAFSPEDAVTSLSAQHPVLMLPVRIETRFFDAGSTLKVRVFPDQVHVTAHDPALTSDEVDSLTWYWTTRWADPDPATDRGRALAETAWEGLTSRFRAGRAAFLVRAYPPGNLGSGDPEPTWPELPRRAGAWSAVGRASLLPDRWCVIGLRSAGEGRHTQIFRVWGSAVPDALAASPDPDPGAPAAPGGLPDDPDLAWLHNAVEAERLGMLVTVRQADLVAGARLADGVDRLVVLGVDWTLDPHQAADAVEAHLAAHAYEGHLAFVPQGSPTNSTGTTRSPYTTDPAVARQVLAPHTQPPAADGSAGALTAAALGLPGPTLLQIAGADLREQAWQGALLEATWAAIGGYYLTEMLDPVADDPSIEASLRHHVATYLRAGGPLPTLRVGAQPYGILPVVPRGRFEPDVRRRAHGDVLRVTSALRDLVEPLVPTVPRLASVRRREDVDDLTLALLQRTPVAWELTFRTLVGPVERKAVSVYWDSLAALQSNVTALLFSRLRCYRLTQLSELTHDKQDHLLRVPLVLKPDPTPQNPKRQSTEYLSEIRAMLTEPKGPLLLAARKDSIALLEAFVACAAPTETVRAGKTVLAQQAVPLQLSAEFAQYVSRSADRVPYSLRVESAAVAPAAAGATTAVPRTPLELIQTVVPALTGARTIGEFVAQEYAAKRALPGILDLPDNAYHRLHRFDQALATLEQAPADQLEWAFRGVLDLYSTRLDAWITSLATARHAEHRAETPDGLHVGGWGVVEDLHPDSGPAAESLGFLHTPSMAQAASTAVLRSARLAHKDDEGRLFDLDLTSRRVRQALRILEGVTAGQRLAALLGYRIERGLQERDLLLAQWILPLRQQCPLRSDRPEDPQAAEPVEAVAARDVVDGLALLARWESERVALLNAAGIPAGAHPGVAAVLDEVVGLSDAVSDVLLSEAVHQATSGNLERSAAALAAHDRQAPAPDPEFIRTPRGGPVVTHRVGVWLPRQATDPAPGWPRDVRSLAEPRLDRWLGTVLGDPRRWTVSASLLRPPAPGPDGTAPPQAVALAPVSVASLGLSALSLVLAARRPGDDRSSELESRLAGLYAASPDVAALAPTPLDRLELAGEDLALLLDLAAWAGEVLTAAPLAAEHLASGTDVRLGGGGPIATADAAEAVARADAVQAFITGAVAGVEQARADYLASPDARTEAALLDALDAVAQVDASPEQQADLVEHTTGVLARVRARLAAAAALPTPPPPTPEPGDLPVVGTAEDGQVVRSRGVVATLLGVDQPFLPVLTSTDPDTLSAPLAARTSLLGGDPTAAATWLHVSALVRPALDPFAALLVHAEADGAPVPDDLAVLQYPHDPARPWVALPHDSAGEPVAGTVALTLHAPDGVTPADGGSGLVVDSWNDAIPAAEETTAVTFHYDAPGARAPQAMLLAVHPAISPERWDLDTLLGCVNEAVDLAHLRTVGSRELAPFSTFLPAVFLPDTYTHDVPGIRLAELLENAKAHQVGGLLTDHVLGKG